MTVALSTYRPCHRRRHLRPRQNDNLEQQAQALFDYYFLQHTELLGDATESNLTGIASYLNGLAMQKFRPEDDEEGLPVLKIKELGQNCTDASSDRCSSSIDEKYIIEDGEVIFSWSGTLMVRVWTGGRCGLNQHLFVVRSQQYPKWFIYFWTKYHLDTFIRIAQDKAVTMGHIKRGELDKSKVIIPSPAMMTKLDALISPIFEQMIDKSIENRNLAELRDNLLPKLMSGELKIEEMNR